MKTGITVKLPTQDKTSQLLVDDTGDLLYSKQLGFDEFNIDNNFQHKRRYHLYIISEEKIVRGDMCYDGEQGKIYDATKVTQHNKVTLDYPIYKILASTDTKLTTYEYTGVSDENGGIEETIKHSLPQIPHWFIEKYVNSYNSGKVIKNIEYELKGYVPCTNGKPCAEISLNPKENTDIRLEIKELIKIKDSFTREEVETIFERARHRVTSTLNGTYFKYSDLESCINDTPTKY